MLNIYEELQKILSSDEIFCAEDMKNHTSFRIGGKADYFVTPSSMEEIKEVLKFAKNNDVPLTIIGNGTNLLVKDGGIRGITLKPNLQDLSIYENDDDVQITVGSGYSVSKLAMIATSKEITGLEFLSGIPGTIGGAITMNAGAYGSEMKDCVVQTKCMDYDGNIIEINGDEHKFGYRTSIFENKKYIILETKLNLKYGEKQAIEAKVLDLIKQRKEKQPLTMPSAGSVFKRGNGFVTAHLIDEADLKGYSIGDAQVSEIHAGFIVNKGNATAKDVIELIDHIKKVILEKYNEELELEVIIVGEDRRAK